MSSNRSSRLRACCTIHSPVGFAVALPSCNLMTKAQVSSSIEYSSVQGHVQVQLPGPSRRINQPPLGLPGNTR